MGLSALSLQPRRPSVADWATTVRSIRHRLMTISHPARYLGLRQSRAV